MCDAYCVAMTVAARMENVCMINAFCSTAATTCHRGMPYHIFESEQCMCAVSREPAVVSMHACLMRDKANAVGSRIEHYLHAR